MTCRWLQCSGLWVVPFSWEVQAGSGSCWSLQHRRTLNYSVTSSQLQGSGVCFSCTKPSAMAQERSGHELICFFSHDSTFKWGDCWFVLQQLWQVLQNCDKICPNIPTVNIGKGKYRKNKLAYSQSNNAGNLCVGSLRALKPLLFLSSCCESTSQPRWHPLSWHWMHRTLAQRVSAVI